MKKIITKSALLLALVFIAGACATSNDVASNRLIQKRKHLKGFHISTKQSLFKKSTLKSETPDLLVDNNVKNEITNYNDLELAHEAQIAPSVKKLVKNEKAEENLAIQKQVVKTKAANEATPIRQTESSVNSEKKVRKNLKKSLKDNFKQSDKADSPADDTLILLVILCFLLPPIAVGIKTSWDIKKLLISILLTILGWLPGIIYALLIVFDVI